MSENQDTLDRPGWALDPAATAEQCQAFIREVLAASGHDGVVVGLSGGIDSAVSAALAAAALGPDQVLGVMMPYRSSSAASLADARQVAESIGIATEEVEITSLVDAYLDSLSECDPVRRGNVMARARMIVLYDLSAREGRLVLGTGNRTEALLGYTTHHGDNACALNPIGQLYKTEVRLLAAQLELPAAVLDKAPSADLWEGQADEDELGFSYAVADRLLHFQVDERLGPRQLEALGIDRSVIEKVSGRVAATAFKRGLPPVTEFPGRLDPDLDRTP